MAPDKTTPEGLTGILGMLQTVMNNGQAQAASIADLQRAQDSVARDVSNLIRNIRGNNGSDGLLVKIALLEQSINSLASSLTDVRKALDARQAEDQKGRWQLVGIIIAGVLALLSAAFTALLAMKK